MNRTTALRVWTASAAALVVFVGGCADRRILVTSEPSGATVFINDVEVGRTPVSAGFTYYGVYDVRLRRDGFEPISTSAKADAPLYEYAGADLITEAIPGGVLTEVKWHFTMTPSPEHGTDKKTFEADLIRRAAELRAATEQPAAK